MQPKMKVTSLTGSETPEENDPHQSGTIVHIEAADNDASAEKNTDESCSPIAKRQRRRNNTKDGLQYRVEHDAAFEAENNNNNTNRHHRYGADTVNNILP